jgi:hypothetical protein
MRVGAVGISALLVAGAGGLCAGQKTGKTATEVYPMRKGTHWIYRGDVSNSNLDQNFDQTLNWEMEVADSMNRGRYKVALIIGHPDDLTFYEEAGSADAIS